MAKAVFATYLIALTICLISAYKQECAVGPEYWCKSFQNAQDCGALRHCTETVWRYDEKHTKVDSSTKCDWCKKILENTHKAIENVAQNEELIKITLANGCKLLPLEDISSKCTHVIENYGKTVLLLMKQQRYDRLCHLMDICPSEIREVDEDKENINLDQQSKILCNVIVRATHDLHVKQQKTKTEIELFLKNDCQQLKTSQLIEKCEDLLERHGNEIYAHVASHVELSKICDYINSSALQSTPQVHCELCEFVLSVAKEMLDAKHTEDKVLIYIDEEICSRLNGKSKKNCKEMIDRNGKDLINNIRNGIQSILLCTHFEVCSEKILDATSSIKKDEIHSFLLNNLCEKLGLLKNACQALIEKDATQILQILTNEINGEELCHMFGLCPKASPLLDEFVLKDDPSQCKRCVKDFTRRKHIAERLVNHSSEFLHHLCGQLPQQDDCTKAVDDSINELLTFIRSLDPRDICVQLNMCDQKLLETIEVSLSDNVINEEINEYIKNDICKKLGSLSSFCMKLIDSEGLNLLNLISKNIDPHQICDILDICPSNIVFKNCHDKCQCCTNKVEIYQKELEKFMRTIVASTRIMCDHVPGRDRCLQLADIFESNVKKVVAHFDSKRTCQLLSLCTLSEKKLNEDQCQICKAEIDIRQSHFYVTVNELTTTLLSSCKDSNCRLNVQSLKEETLEKINNINSQKLCQSLGYCIPESSFEPSSTFLRLKSLVQHQTKTLEERLELHNICSEYEQLKPICKHLLISVDTHRYAYVYKSLLENNPKLIDDDLREQMKTNIHTDVCDSCKNAVQSSKDFWKNALDSILNVLLHTCDYCSAKDQCRDYYNRRFDNLKSYLDNIDPAQFCQNIRLCISSHHVIRTDKCTTCVERLQQRKDGILRGIDRIAAYFNDVCQRFAVQQCQVFVKQIQNSFEQSVKQFDPKQTCQAIGFCSATSNMDFDKFEKFFEDELDKNVCSTLGPFETMCKQMIRGNRKQIETTKINYNIKDLMQIGEKKTTNFFTAAHLNECSQDKCQCCIDGVNKKKECAKSMVDNIISVFTRACDYCPSKDQCIKYWKDTQTQFDSCIDDVDAKQICTRLGFCNASTLCANMGVFQQSCEEVLNKFTHSLEHDPETLEKHLPHTSVVVLPTKPEPELVNDSNSTCILCEYVMNILSNYIHQQSTEEEIEQSLQKVCNQMPGTLQKQCHELIDNYGPTIIATLIGHFDTATVCRRLNLCTQQMKVQLSHITKANQATCGVCDYVSTYINFALKRDSSDQSLDHALSTVCSHLSSDQTSQCQMLVELFRPHIRKLELHLGNNFCKQLTICQTETDETSTAKLSIDHETLNKDDEIKRIIMKNLDDTPECTLCHYIVSYLDAVLKTNKSEAAVEAALEKVCVILPSKERAQCQEFVKTYGPVLAELIAEMADPDTICRYLGMCQVSLPQETVTTKKPAPITYPNHDYVRLPNEQNELTCTVCQYVISRMKKLIILNQTEEEIIATLKKSCDSFSVLHWKKQCDDFVDQYGQYIIQMISSDVNPKVACQSLKICTTNSPATASTRRQSTPPVPVATSTMYGKCIYGKNYWCTSRQNAILCNAVELCEREVWSKKNKNIVI